MNDINTVKTKTESPLISLIVPAHNIESYLSDCLDSILMQSYRNIEIIVIDDGSADNTGKTADDYRKKHQDRIICIHQKNMGVSKARLNGIAVAHGQWIGFVDGDDCVENDMYERLLNNALTSNADISHCGFQIVVNQGERIHYFYNTGKKKEQNKEEGIRDLISGEFIEPSLCNKLFRRFLFDNALKNEVLNNDYRFNEDLLLNYLLFKESDKAVYEDFCPYHYMSRVDSASRSVFNIRRITDPLAVQRFILEDTEGELKKEAYRRYLMTCINACISLHGKEEYSGIYDEIRDTLHQYDFCSHVLSGRLSFKLHLLLMSPGLFCILYKFYTEHFQKKKYE